MPQRHYNKLSLKKQPTTDILEHTELRLNQYGVAEPTYLQQDDESTWIYWCIGTFILAAFSVLVYVMLHYLDML